MISYHTFVNDIIYDIIYDTDREMQANPRGERIYAFEANGSVAFQLAQLSMGPDTVPMALVAYIDGTFMKRGIGIRPIYCEYIRYHI